MEIYSSSRRSFGLDKEKVLSLISDEHDLIMAIPFPYEGTRKIKVDFERDF